MINCIIIGLGKFSLGRLKILIESKEFNLVGIVDKDIKYARKNLSGTKFNNFFSKKIFKTLDEAKKKLSFEAVFIFSSSETHASLTEKSLKAGYHTFCVKPLANSYEEVKKVFNAHKKNLKLILIQGLNNQWNEASLKMQEILKDRNLFGEFLMGNCLVWGRQNLKSPIPVADTTKEGIFFHSMACHQLGQLVSSLGLPKKVKAYTSLNNEASLGFNGIRGTSDGSAIFTYKKNRYFTYTATRGGHGNPFDFASRWSGKWLLHGTKADLRRDGGRITLFREGNIIHDCFYKDLDEGLIKDDSSQFKYFYDKIKNKSNKFNFDKYSINTWILMQRCIESFKKEKELKIKGL